MSVALARREGVCTVLLPRAFPWGFLAAARLGRGQPALPKVLWQFWWVTTCRGWSEMRKFIASPRELNLQQQLVLLLEMLFQGRGRGRHVLSSSDVAWWLLSCVSTNTLSCSPRGDDPALRTLHDLTMLPSIITILQQMY